MRFWAKYIVAGVILFVCALPLVAVAWSSGFAKRHGCVLHEGYANPCVVNGTDYGDLLATAFLSGWFMLLTIPLGAATLLVVLGFAAWDVVRARRRNRG